MRIAITGGAGFIGSKLAELLEKQGHEVFILDLPAYDVTDSAAMMEALTGIDAIYHLAAEHRDDVRPIQKYYDVNVGGAENIIAAAKAHNIPKIIFTSSVAVYGLDAGESKESSAPAPFNDYGQSKWESEKIFESWAQQNPDHKLVTIRLVATFGPGNRGNIYNLMNQIAGGKFLMVGSGKNRKSIAYVGNVAAFLAHLLKCEAGTHLYNYADKPDISMNEMVGIVRGKLGQEKKLLRVPYIIGLAGGFVFDVAAKITGRRFPISAVRVQKFCADTVVNAEKMRGTGFVPPYSLKQGLEEMIEAEFT